MEDARVADATDFPTEPATRAEQRRELPTVRDVLAIAFRRLMRLYFRDIERVGEPPGADTRGRVIVSNHTNGLIDAVLVLTDAACEISPVAKSTLWSIPGLRWLLDRGGAVPIVRRKDYADKDSSQNAAMFDKIATHLAGGGNILIFPEGTSHSESHLAPFRSGAARMLLAAEQARGLPPTFQAAALEFDARTDFRSRCLVLWGPVRRFADVPGTTEEERIKAATSLMHADLADLLIEGETHEERLRIARIAELLANDDNDPSLSRWSGIGHRVELAARTLRNVDPKLIARVSEHVDTYYAELERLGLDDARISRGTRRERDGHLPMWKRALLAPLAASGVALYGLPYFIPRLVARSKDADERSTIKLGVSLMVYPLWMAGLVGGSLVLLPPPLSLIAAAVAITSPFAALRWLDAWYTHTADPTTEELAQLARLRIAARTAIDDARARLPS
jgi:glycerol-3-phosphate O-acyltransferase / dihydroxyacetone phosphate acyltransferase